MGIFKFLLPVEGIQKALGPEEGGEGRGGG